MGAICLSSIFVCGNVNTKQYEFLQFTEMSLCPHIGVDRWLMMISCAVLIFLRSINNSRTFPTHIFFGIGIYTYSHIICLCLLISLFKIQVQLRWLYVDAIAVMLHTVCVDFEIIQLFLEILIRIFL